MSRTFLPLRRHVATTVESFVTVNFTANVSRKPSRGTG